MSRSRKKVPICGITKSKSDKPYKKYLHQKRRAQLLLKLSHTNFDDADVDMKYNSWDSCKDGKQYVKNPLYRERVMRK